MAVGPNTIVVNVPADMSRERFASVLRAANSPALSEADAGYDAIVAERVSVRFALAIFAHESNYGNLGVTPTFGTKNPGNCRTSRTGDYPLVNVPGKGNYVKYPTWAAGWRDLAHRIVDPSFVYVQEGRDTIGEIILRWAPPSDDNNTQAYINTVIARMNGWGDEAPQPEPEPTPMPDDITFGLVPLPPMQDRIITNSTAWNDLGARVIRGVVWHRMLGTLVGTDGYFRTDAAGRALTDYGIGVGTDGANDGVIFKWNDPRGRRSPWANGPVSAPYGDGKAFIDRYGINASQRDLVSIEISGMQKTPLTAKSRQAIAHLTAYWADQAHIPWDTFPAVPNEGRAFTIWHEELTKGTGKACPFEVVKGETPALIEEARAILKQYQASGEPVPVPPPTPVPPPPGIDYPDQLDKGLMERMFGSVTGEDGKSYRYTEDGKVSKVWRENYGPHGWPALAEVWSYDNGARRFFRFPGAPTIFVGGDGVPVIVK